MFNTKSARLMAETLWGRGDTDAQRCNSLHAHWFECSEHGGMILDAASLSDEQRDELDAISKPVEAYTLMAGSQVMRAGFGEPTAVHKSWSEQRHEVYVFEKDRDWCIPVITLGLGRLSDMRDPLAINEASRLFKRFFDVHSPEARARAALEGAENGGNPDMIVAGVRTANDIDRVWTSDGQAWDVTGYENAQNEEDGLRYLSKCDAYKPANAPDTEWVYPDGNSAAAQFGWDEEPD